MRDAGERRSTKINGGADVKTIKIFLMDDPETVLLVDEWEDQAAIDRHHASPMMEKISALREKYDLHMRVERYISETEGLHRQDEQFIRK